MKTKQLIFATFTLLFFAFTACNKDDENLGPKGHLSIEITDAPADDASIEGVFVTIADIKVDGKSLDGFSKTTLDLMAYQNGNTKFLITEELVAGTYNSITLVLDHEKDANGNSPGCYVKETNGSKQKLAASSVEIVINQQIQVDPDMETEVIIDIDIRKAIQRGQGSDSKYEFVASVNLNNSVRMINKQEAGLIEGKCYYQVTNSDVVLVYAYKKGTFNRNTEMQGSSQSNLKFHNAVSSSKVDANGNYELHFLKKGDYELHFVSYSRNSLTGRIQLAGTLLLNMLTAVDITSVNVRAENTTVVDVQATGVLPF